MSVRKLSVVPLVAAALFACCLLIEPPGCVGQARTLVQKPADLKLIQGTWNVVAMEFDGNKMAEQEATQLKMVFTEDRVTYEGRIIGQGTKLVYAPGSSNFSYKLDPEKNPKTIDITADQGNPKVGIYQLDGDTLKLCISYVGERPHEFSSKGKSGVGCAVLKREKR